MNMELSLLYSGTSCLRLKVGSFITIYIIQTENKPAQTNQCSNSGKGNLKFLCKNLLSYSMKRKPFTHEETFHRSLRASISRAPFYILITHVHFVQGEPWVLEELDREIREFFRGNPISSFQAVVPTWSDIVWCWGILRLCYDNREAVGVANICEKRGRFSDY